MGLRRPPIVPPPARISRVQGSRIAMARQTVSDLQAAGFLPQTRGTSLLRVSDLLRISFREVMRKRRRYIGVVAAIALGTAGFITIVTMGRDLKANFNNDLDLLGGATIIAAHFDPPMYERQEWFRTSTLEALRNLPGVKDITTVRLRNVVATTYKEKTYGFNLLGVDSNYWDLFSFSAKYGRLFGEEDVTEGRKVLRAGPGPGHHHLRRAGERPGPDPQPGQQPLPGRGRARGHQGRGQVPVGLSAHHHGPGPHPQHFRDIERLRALPDLGRRGPGGRPAPRHHQEPPDRPGPAPDGGLGAFEAGAAHVLVGVALHLRLHRRHPGAGRLRHLEHHDGRRPPRAPGKSA